MRDAPIKKIVQKSYLWKNKMEKVSDEGTSRQIHCKMVKERMLVGSPAYMAP